VALYAQTNIQFFNQLRSLEYSAADLVLIRDSYELATELFARRFRPSGKPFLCHLVGTASILASLKVSPILVAAGLLHAAYAQSNFWASRRARRRWVRSVVNSEVEKLVASYGKFQWSEKTVPEIYEAIDRMSNSGRDILLIRLANELEDHLDLGALYCANAESRRKHIQSYLHFCVQMAERLDQRVLAEALERAFSETLVVEIPAFLRSGQRKSFVTHAFSWRRWIRGKPFGVRSSD